MDCRGCCRNLTLIGLKIEMLVYLYDKQAFYYFRISEGSAGSSLILQYLGLNPLNRSIVCFKPDKE